LIDILKIINTVTFKKAKKLFLVFFLLLSHQIIADRTTLDKIAAVVGDGVVLESQIDIKYKNYINQFTEQNPSQELPPESLIKKNILDNLIIEELLFQKAKRFGIRISDQELNDYIARIAINNDMNLEEFIDEISSQTSFKSFRENLKNDLIIQRVQRGLVGPKVFISDQEIKNFIISKEGQNLILVEYKINQILVDSEEISKKIYQRLEEGEDFLNLKTRYDVSGDEELPKWQQISELPSLFSIVKDMEIGSYSQPLKTGAGFYLIKLEEKRGDTVRIENQDLVRHILIQTSEIRNEKQARELINEIKNRIDDGEDFKVLARLYSDDPSSKLDGGNLGWSSSDKYDSEFKKVVDDSGLNKVSNVFKSSFGHHILEVLDRRQKDVSKELQKNKAYRIIFDRKYEEQLQKTLQELRAESYIDIKTEI
tara:strand:+ start:1988 stop:3265 length:1278 start_codon:yes stop_codon:yes gene_type:complete